MSKEYVAYLITWTESERGWGQRPDGASLHMTQDDAKTYLDSYWKSMPDEVPDEYSRNDSGTGKLVVVSSDMYSKLKTSKNRSVRLFEHEYSDARKRGDIRK